MAIAKEKAEDMQETMAAMATTLREERRHARNYCCCKERRKKTCKKLWQSEKEQYMQETITIAKEDTQETMVFAREEKTNKCR